jgi:NADH dehydrogenase
MRQRRICILGGSGFIGRHITRRLAAAGHEVTIITRRRERQRDLLVLPTVQLVQGDVHNPTLLQRQFEGQDAVINLVGILNEPGHDGKGFERVHVLLADKVAHACRHSGVPRLLHMSALHASLTAPSRYLRTKGLGEKLVFESAGPHLHVTAFRPSVIFGEQDSFTNRFARLLRLAPGVFPLACADARFQPVYVDDVAQVFVDSLDRHSTHGQRYDLCGPRSYSLRELVEYLASISGRRCRVLGLNRRLSWLQAALLEYVPGKPFSLDNFLSLQVDSVCQAGFPAVFGLTPTHLEDVVPRYLGTQRAQPSVGI